MPSTIHLQKTSPFGYFENVYSKLYHPIEGMPEVIDIMIVTNVVALGIINDASWSSMLSVIGLGIAGRLAATKATNFSKYISNGFLKVIDEEPLRQIGLVKLSNKLGFDIKILTMMGISYIVGMISILAFINPNSFTKIFASVFMQNCFITFLVGVTQTHGANTELSKLILNFFVNIYLVLSCLILCPALLGSISSKIKFFHSVASYSNWVLNVFCLGSCPITFITDLMKASFGNSQPIKYFNSIFMLMALVAFLGGKLLCSLGAIFMGAFTGITEEFVKTTIECDKGKESIAKQNFFSLLLTNYFIKKFKLQDGSEINKNSSEFTPINNSLDEIQQIYGEYFNVLKELIEEFIREEKLPIKENMPMALRQLLDNKIDEKTLYTLLQEAREMFNGLEEGEKVQFTMLEEQFENENLNKLLIEARKISGAIQFSTNQEVNELNVSIQNAARFIQQKLTAE